MKLLRRKVVTKDDDEKLGVNWWKERRELKKENIGEKKTEIDWKTK